MAQTVIITGASQGIGKATAFRFAQEGFNLVIAARQPERLAILAEEIQQQGHQVLAIPADVSNPQQVNDLIDKALEVYGNIDVLVNNAGICFTGPIEQTTLSDWHQVMDTNFWGCVHTIQALLPHFLARRTGTIVNVGSFGGKVPLPYMTIYCASKYAVSGLTETLRLELAEKGIQVCAVHPSVTKSDFLERAVFRGNDRQDAQSRRQQMEQLLDSSFSSKVEDVAEAIWDIVKYPKAEVVVGSAAMPTAAYRLAPGLMQWVLEHSSRLIKSDR